MNHQAVTVRKVLSATREEVFDAWLDPVGMQQWLRPGPVASCEVELEPWVGGRFCIIMRLSNSEGEIVNTGQFLMLDRPSRLQFTWISSRWDNEETVITVELREHGANCELVLIHERFPASHSTLQLESGWNQIVEKLGRHLFSGSFPGRV
jgi:uncharacterized protein YndB with AHSA1/START domain